MAECAHPILAFAQTMNLIINLDKDDTLILPRESESSLASFGIGEPSILTWPFEKVADPEA